MDQKRFSPEDWEIFHLLPVSESKRAHLYAELVNAAETKSNLAGGGVQAMVGEPAGDSAGRGRECAAVAAGDDAGAPSSGSPAVSGAAPDAGA